MSGHHPSKWIAVCTLITVSGCASFDHSSHPLSSMRNISNLHSEKTLAAHHITPANWPTYDWWSRYGDPQLGKLIIEAFEDSPNIAAAMARVRQAQAFEEVTDAARYPQLNAGLKSTRQRYSENGTAPKVIAGTWQTLNDTALSSTYEFDFWGKNQSAVEAAVDRLHATEVDKQAAKLMVASAITQAYIRLSQIYDQIDLAEQVLVDRREILALTEQRRAAGIDSEVDVKQAESAIPAARQSLVALNEALSLTRSQLAALLGQGPDRGQRIQRPVLAINQATALPSNLPAELIGHRPDVVAQRWRVEAAGKDIQVAKTMFYPNISLLAFAGFQSFGLSEFLNIGSRVAGIGPAISMPIFDGGRLRGNLRGRQADYDFVVEQYNQTIIDAVHDVVNQATSFQSVAEQRRLQSEAVLTAQRAYELARQRYQAGIGSYLQVLTVESQVQNQKRTLIDLNARALQLDAHLIRALGGGLLETN